MSANRCFLLSPRKRLSAASFQEARPYPGRWHRAGQQACYGFEHPALAMLEREVISGGRCLVPLYLHETLRYLFNPVDLRQVRAGQEQVVGADSSDNPLNLLPCRRPQFALKGRST